MLKQVIPNVHCAGLLDVQGASQNVVSADTVDHTEGHSFGDHPISESVSVMPSSVIEASFYCALLCVFMARVRYNLEQRVFIYDCYVGKKNSYKSCRRKFRRIFPNATCPSGDTISKLETKVRTDGILIDRKPLKRNRVSTEKKLDDIGH
jgi:hypothetical protein